MIRHTVLMFGMALLAASAAQGTHYLFPPLQTDERRGARSVAVADNGEIYVAGQTPSGNVIYDWLNMRAGAYLLRLAPNGRFVLAPINMLKVYFFLVSNFVGT